jgi:hypothetical protein
MNIPAINPVNQPAVDAEVLAIALVEDRIRQTMQAVGDLIKQSKASGDALVYDMVPDPNDPSWTAPSVSLPSPETGFSPFCYLEMLEYLGKAMAVLGEAADHMKDAHSAIRYQYCKHGIIATAGGGK